MKPESTTFESILASHIEQFIIYKRALGSGSRGASRDGNRARSGRSALIRVTDQS